MSALIRLLLWLLIGFSAGCATVGAGAKADADHEKAPELSKQRLILSQGYSMLYTDASHVDLLGLILYVKTGSDDFEKLITSLSDFGGDLKKDLERIAKDYPGVRIDLDPLPEMEKRKRTAIAKDKAIQFAPVVGIGGVEYERSTLISMSNAVNHESHLCRVMAAEETDPNLKKFLLEAEKHYHGLYMRINALMDRKYFRTKTSKPEHSKK